LWRAQVDVLLVIFGLIAAILTTTESFLELLMGYGVSIAWFEKANSSADCDMVCVA
jgi:hypothetical protein